MTKYTVLPRNDGQDFRNSWMIHKNGQMKSNHTTKQAAVNAARSMATEGDTLEIRRTDGTIQKRVTVQGSSSSSSSQEESAGFMVPGVGSNPGYGEGTLEENNLF